jgi:hypothetical protein
MRGQLLDMVLPRLAKTLFQEIQRYRDGQLQESDFPQCFETLLRRQHAWLMRRGMSDVNAAVAVHGAILLLSAPGLKAESAEGGEPFEWIECRAVREAAADVAGNYGIAEDEAFQMIGNVLNRYDS